MFKDLNSGTKISITRSIKTAFEQYMTNIEWDEKKYNLQDFIEEWRTYINENASWYKDLSVETKNDTGFHQDLATKINETIEKVLTEEPTEDQINQIDQLQNELKTDYDFSCKAEAKYLLDKLENERKKK